LPYITKNPTFGDSVSSGDLIWIYCRGCLREFEICATAMPPGIPHATLFPDIVKYLRCGTCGSKRIWVMPEVHRGGFILARARQGSPRALVVRTPADDRN